MAVTIEVDVDDGEKKADNYKMTNCHTFEPK